MFRSFARLSLVIVVALALGLATVAPATAREARRPVPEVTNNHWAAGALAWFRTALGIAPAAPRTATQAKLIVRIDVDGDGGGAQVNTGSCIDPMGRRVPCSPTGGTM